ncbi:hypothetical protein HGP14_34260 [Rhizobium sp. P32RR-XVIII]|uniref:hypothetical protein n=1 Tax=Rhizobium sp. P32RR-XVIII TaxID=2726738 RepID=UPI001457594E|nr:hypothetical protein [Rhizobium sp. P32RR-XVIII]NLS08256.1 hypothetical protein [Rhizobium sp. P32RR-XVIII]
MYRGKALAVASPYRRRDPAIRLLCLDNRLAALQPLLFRDPAEARQYVASPDLKQCCHSDDCDAEPVINANDIQRLRWSADAATDNSEQGVVADWLHQLV